MQVYQKVYDLKEAIAELNTALAASAGDVEKWKLRADNKAKVNDRRYAKAEIHDSLIFAQATKTALQYAIHTLEGIDVEGGYELLGDQVPENVCLTCGAEDRPRKEYCEWIEDNYSCKGCSGGREFHVVAFDSNSKVEWQGDVCFTHMRTVCEDFDRVHVTSLKRQEQKEEPIVGHIEPDPELLALLAEEEELDAQMKLAERVRWLEEQHEKGNHNIPSDIARAKNAGCPICNLPTGSTGQL